MENKSNIIFIINEIFHIKKSVFLLKWKKAAFLHDKLDGNIFICWILMLSRFDMCEKSSYLNKSR